MDLYLFPTSAHPTIGGYRIAVYYSYGYLKPKPDDLVIWYSNDHLNVCLKENNIIIPRRKKIDIKRFYNMLLNRVGAELLYSELSFLKKYKFDNIYCDEVIFYRAIRKLFPDKYITVRFHNCFSRIKNRLEILELNYNYKLKLDMLAFSSLEGEIFRDEKVNKIFISKEDLEYYNLMMKKTDGNCIPFKVDLSLAKKNRKPYKCFKYIVWYGGVQAHKHDSISWFIHYVLPKVKVSFPEIEFHLWGERTEKFDDPKNRIFGHGFYKDNDFPLSENSIYINPDIMGGGIKIKLISFFEAGIPFITTPFGFEGYSNEIIDDCYCIVVSMDNWAKKIIELLSD